MSADRPEPVRAEADDPAPRPPATAGSPEARPDAAPSVDRPTLPEAQDDGTRPGPALMVVAAAVALAAGAALRDQAPGVALAGGCLAGIGTLLAVIDARTHRLPDRLVLAGTVGVLALLLLAAATGAGWAPLGRAVLAAAAAFAVYLVLGLVRVGGLGFGDVKLAGLLGLWLGWFGWSHVVLGLAGGFVIGGFYALALLVTRRATRTSFIAFGPWMILGAAVTTALAVAG
ncbi:prepilin peptidase [Georgenia sp. AZ-5]|uniref:prepilin peptidase n=1 Tax=Georgenia sp. AZ-5 TaxID=3367526 RepID=UPI003754F396